MFRRGRNSTTSGRQRTMSNSSSALPASQSSPHLDGRGNTISNTDYARKCRELMDLSRDLRNLGVNALFDLPRVVVIGGQSSGKSSLVEAVSGINVPRDSGTCTRCPMECSMSSDATSWSCSVKICFEFDQSGSPQTPRTESFGPTIENKPAVELWIRRAQAAVLSPHRPPSDFLTMSDEELKKNAHADPQILLFSKNVVQVNVKDPDATDLSFVDLPGLIQNADDALISMVRTLVESYVTGKNTLIVIAMPMSDDIEMLQAVVIAKNATADPNRARTIGVLTKPDTLAKGATGGRERWKAVLEGREHATKHGYYCVRLPDDEERTRGITKSEAQRVADDFFNTMPPWNQMPDRSRFGIPNFVANISALLVQLIETNLPSLKKTIESELQQCYNDIAQLPSVSKEQPSTEVMLRVTEFCKDIRDTVFGEKYKHFVQANRTRYLRFKEDILMTTPDFRPYESSTFSGRSLVNTRTQPRYLEDVRNVIKGSITWELPRHVPFEATKTLVIQYTRLWKDPSFECFNDIVNSTSAILEELLQRHFGQYTELEKYVRMLSFKERDSCRDEACVMLQRILRLESNPLFTQNFDLLEQEENRWFSLYSTTPSTPSIERWPMVPPPSLIHFFPSQPSDQVLDSSPLTWTTKDELKIMANVQAYFQVAYKRIIDYVPLVIEHELNQTFASNLGNIVFDSIFKDSKDGEVNFEGLLKEDPIIAAKRKDLEGRKVRLLQIKARLDNFPNIA